jgi:integrase
MAAQKKRRSSGTGSIFKDGRGYYTAQVLVGYKPDTGKPKYITKRSKVERVVVDWLNAQIVKTAQGISLAPERVTVETFLNRWLESVERSNRYSTHKSYAQVCRDHVIPRIGKVLMAKVTLPHIQRILDTMHDAGKARNTIRNVKAALVTATADYEKQYPNAYHAVRAAKLPKAERKAKPVMHALSPEQAQVLLMVVEGERLKALYWVVLLLGLRRGEILGLHVEDIDLDAREMHIRGAMQYQKGKGNIIVPTKTSASEAPLPLPDVLIPILREHLAMLAEERTYSKWKEHGLLFPTSLGTPMGARNLVRHFKMMIKRAGLPDVRFHDLRHSCATLLITLGVHPRIIMEILRHTQISTTMNTYGHVIPGVNRDALNNLGDLLKPQTIELPKRVKKDDEKR